MDKSRRKILILTGNADFRHETGRRMYNPQKAHKLWTEKGLLKILKENSSTADIPKGCGLRNKLLSGIPNMTEKMCAASETDSRYQQKNHPTAKDLPQ